MSYGMVGSYIVHPSQLITVWIRQRTKYYSEKNTKIKGLLKGNSLNYERERKIATQMELRREVRDLSRRLRRAY